MPSMPAAPPPCGAAFFSSGISQMSASVVSISERIAEEVAHCLACKIVPDGIVKLTKAQLIEPRDIEVEPIDKRR